MSFRGLNIKAPVLIVCYRRDQLLKRLLDIIAKVPLTTLYIYQDGCKNADHAKDVKDVERVISDFVKVAPFKTEVFQSPQNLGVDKFVPFAIDACFTKTDRLIILEDDLIPDESFFHFCDELLAYHLNNSEIGQISGYNGQKTSISENKIKTGDSYFYSNFFLINGWATWRRAWTEMIKDKDELRKTWESLNLKEICPSFRERVYQNYHAYKKFFNRKRGPNWDFRWKLTNWSLGRRAICPAVPLVVHFDNSSKGVHTKSGFHVDMEKPDKMEFPLKHPTDPRLRAFDWFISDVLFSKSLTYRLKIFLKRFSD